MKKLRGLIKLTKFNSENVNGNELNHALGGACSCSCFWAACGGSSRSNNDTANNEKGYVSPLPPVGVDCGIVT